MNMIRFLHLLTVSLLVAVSAAGEVRLAPLFATGAVLQRDRPVPVWGFATAGSTISVRFADQTLTTTTDASGVWRVELAPMPASAMPQTLSVNDVRLEDLLVGDVWLCSGQSNMEWALDRCVGGPEAVAAASNVNLRLCLVPHNAQQEPQREVAARWMKPEAKTVRTFSAIAYWFGDQLQRETGVPVGIIANPYGGTIIEGWLPRATLQQGPWPQDKRTNLELALADDAERRRAAQDALTAYETEKVAAQQAGRPAPPAPPALPGDLRGPSMLWNGMLAPLAPYRLRGVLWYQGESNAYPGLATTYRDLLPALIRDWRAAFADPELPMVIFQLSRYRKPQADPNAPSGMAELREIQARTVEATPRTALVVTIDLGEEDVHYRDKQPAAARAVHAAQVLSYGRAGDTGGPRFAGLTINGSQAIVRCDRLGGGLVATGGEVGGFIIAGADRVFHPAQARLDGDTVVVSSTAVPQPVAVRYAWGDFPTISLASRAGLPLSPFRSDDWPLPTRAVKQP
jgi:sialate O-acetylesterase